MHRHLLLASAALALLFAAPAVSQESPTTIEPDTEDPNQPPVPPGTPDTAGPDTGTDTTDTPVTPETANPVIEPDTEDPDQPPVPPGTEDTAAPDDGAAGTPQEFATMAANSNMFEIMSSQIALEKAQQDQVREFAQRMIDDHTLAAEEMMQAAEAEGVTEVPQTLDPRQQAMVTQLENATPEDFDSQYLGMQLTAHQEAVALFGDYAQQEGALADFAETTLPTLEEHLAMVQQMAQ